MCDRYFKSSQNIFPTLKVLFILTWIFIFMLSLCFNWDVDRFVIYSFTYLFNFILSGGMCKYPWCQMEFKSCQVLYFLLVNFFHFFFRVDVPCGGGNIMIVCDSDMHVSNFISASFCLIQTTGMEFNPLIQQQKSRWHWNIRYAS